MNNNSARIKQYSKVSTSLAALSNEKLKQILADSSPCMKVSVASQL